MIMPPEFAGPAETTDHFIHNQPDVVLPANFLQEWIILFDRFENTATGCDGLDDQGANAIGTFFEDNILNFTCTLDVAIAICFIVWTAITTGMGDFDKAFDKWTKILFPLSLTSGAHSANSGAMVVTISVHNLVFALSLRTDSRCLPDYLVCFFVCLGAGVGKIDFAHSRKFFQELLGKFDGGNRAKNTGKIRHLLHLRADSISNGISAVTDHNTPDAS